jgi:hypothetical protein
MRRPTLIRRSIRRMKESSESTSFLEQPVSLLQNYPAPVGASAVESF